MITAAKERGVKVSTKNNLDCQTFEELRMRWRDWVPMEEPNLRKDFFHVAVGYFDLRKGWVEELEERYMLEKGLEYKKTEDEETTEITGSQKRKRKPTPFIQRILNTVKAQICVKDLFSHAKKTHGMHITSSIVGGPKNFRRTPGQYDERFLHYYNKNAAKCGKKNLTNHSS